MDSQACTPGPKSEKPGVLLLPMQWASLQELLSIARAMVLDGRYQPIMLLPKPWPGVLETAQVEGIQFVKLYAGEIYPKELSQSLAAAPVSIPAVPTGGWKYTLKKRLKPVALLTLRWIRSTRSAILRATQLDAWFTSWFPDLFDILLRTRRARRVLDIIQPRALLVTGDRSFRDEMAFIQAAREREYPIIIVPFAYSGSGGPASRRKDLPIYRLDTGPQKLLKRWIQHKYPDQIHDSQYGPVFFYSPASIVALAALNMLPARPWCIGGGFSTRVAVTGEEDRERYIQEGVPPHKIVITGEASHDRMYQAMQHVPDLITNLVNKYALEPSKKIVICAIPQLAEHGLISWADHEQGLRTLVSGLVQADANILLSLHPKSKPVQYHFLEEEFPVCIVQEALRDILPAAHVFIAGYSSTVRWAVMLGIPSIVVDFQHYNHDIYDHFSGVLKVFDTSALAEALSKIMSDTSYYDYLRHEQQKSAKRIAPFDGKAVQRLIETIQAKSHGEKVN